MKEKTQVAYIYCSKEGTPLKLAGKVDDGNPAALYKLVNSCFRSEEIEGGNIRNSYDVANKLLIEKEASSLGLNFKLEFKYE